LKGDNLQASVTPQKVSKKQKVSDKAVVMAKQHLRVSRKPVLLSGVQPGKLITITPTHFGNVDVDRRYQRDKITEEINDLIYVLQNGGDIPDPITVVKRLYKEDGVQSGKLWIIDGQQRFMAHLECGRDIRAMCHEVETLEAEKAFFLAMNARRVVGANSVVNSWPGAVADLLKRVDGTVGHPLYGRVMFKASGAEMIGAAILVRGLLAVMTDAVGGGRIDHLLNAAETALKGPRQRLKAEAFLGLIGQVFPHGYAPILPVVALGKVAFERWSFKIETPASAVIAKLRRVNWKAEVPSYAERFRPVLEAHIRRLWK